MRPIKTLVVLANDGQARFLASPGRGKGLTEIDGAAATFQAGAGDEPRDRRGRNAAAAGMARHAFDPPQTELDHARLAFAKAVVAEAETQFRDGRFDRFVLVAAPKTLGMLRDLLPKALKDALVADVDKDLLKKKPDEVVALLADAIVL